jgi:hypothetical protein
MIQEHPKFRAIDDLDKYRRMTKGRARLTRQCFLSKIHHLQKFEWKIRNAEAKTALAGGAM